MNLKKIDYTWIKLMNFFSKSCHQIPERSFFIKGYQMPICSRCLGVYISSLFAIIYFFKRKTHYFSSFIMSFIMFFDWFIQFLNIKKSTNLRRLITGLIGGFGFTILNLKFLKFILNKSNF